MGQNSFRNEKISLMHIAQRGEFCVMTGMGWEDVCVVVAKASHHWLIYIFLVGLKMKIKYLIAICGDRSSPRYGKMAWPAESSKMAGRPGHFF